MRRILSTRRLVIWLHSRTARAARSSHRRPGLGETTLQRRQVLPGPVEGAVYADRYVEERVVLVVDVGPTG